MQADLTLNRADCLWSEIGLGVTRVHNICTGAVADVPWGLGGWALAVLLAGLLLVAIAFCISIALAIWRGW